MKAILNSTHLRLIFVSIMFLVTALLSGIPAQAQTSKDAPRVWEAPLVIPTYELGPPNPYPALLGSDEGGGPFIHIPFLMR